VVVMGREMLATGQGSQPMARELAVMEMVEAKPGAGVLAAARLSAQC
jgi:hypothetical protein